MYRMACLSAFSIQVEILEARQLPHLLCANRTTASFVTVLPCVPSDASPRGDQPAMEHLWSYSAFAQREEIVRSGKPTAP